MRSGGRMMGVGSPEELCDRVRDRLVGALTLSTADRAVAEELAQETLVRVWLHWSRVSTLDSPEHWAMRVGLNLATSWHRRRLAEWRANRRASGERSAEDRHDPAVDAVRQAVASLPPRQRAVIVARFYLGYDVAAAADLLECAPGTIKATTHQAISKLRRSGLLDADEEETA